MAGTRGSAGEMQQAVSRYLAVNACECIVSSPPNAGAAGAAVDAPNAGAAGAPKPPAAGAAGAPKPPPPPKAGAPPAAGAPKPPAAAAGAPNPPPKAGAGADAAPPPKAKAPPPLAGGAPKLNAVGAQSREGGKNKGKHASSVLAANEQGALALMSARTHLEGDVPRHNGDAGFGVSRRCVPVAWAPLEMYYVDLHLSLIHI